MSKNTKQKRTSLSLDDKLRVIEEIEDHPQESRTALASRLGLCLSTVKTIYWKRDEIRRHAATAGSSGISRRRNRGGKYADVEKTLFKWMRQQEALEIPITGPILQAKAREIAEGMSVPNFTASTGWLQRFRGRFGIGGSRTTSGEVGLFDEGAEQHSLPDTSGRTISGGSGSSDEGDIPDISERITSGASGLDEEAERHWRGRRLPDITKPYTLQNIYSLDETGLFFNLLPNKNLTEKQDLCHDGTKSEQRLTVLLGVNADGSHKLRPLVIGKLKNPRCLKEVKTLPTLFQANNMAFITAEIFEEYLRNLDDQMKKEKRKILVLIDSCAAHPRNLSLKNISIAFFPENCSNRLKPNELGITPAFKGFYRKILVETVVASLEKDSSDAPHTQIDVLQAMHFISEAWDLVSGDTIRKCFRQAGIAEETADLDDDVGGGVEELPETDHLRPPPGWQRVSDGLEFHTFLHCDDEVAVCGQQSTDDSAGNLGEEEGEGDVASDYQPELAPSFQEAINGYAAAKRFIGAKEISEDDMRVVSAFGRVLYQAHFSCQR